MWSGGVMMDFGNGWGDDDEFLLDEFEDIIDNEIDCHACLSQADEQPYIKTDNKNEALNMIHVQNIRNENSSEDYPVAGGWGGDDILWMDDEEDLDDASPILQQLQHHILPLSVPLTLTSSTHIETCPAVNLEQALIEEEETKDKTCSLDESAEESSSGIKDSEEKMRFDGETEVLEVQSESPTQEDREPKFVQEDTLSKNDSDNEQDEVLQQLQHHMPPLTIPMQRIRKCSVDVELELALEEEEQHKQCLTLNGGKKPLSEPAAPTIKTSLAQRDPIGAAPEAFALVTDESFVEAPIQSQETSWDLDANLDIDEISDEKTLLKDLESIEINSTAPPSGTLGEPVLYPRNDFNSNSATIDASFLKLQKAHAGNTFSSFPASANGSNEQCEAPKNKTHTHNIHLNDTLVDYPMLLEIEMAKNILLNKQVDTLNQTIEELLSLQESTEILAQQREDKAITNADDFKAQILGLQQLLFTLKQGKHEDEKKIEQLRTECIATSVEREQMQRTIEHMEHTFQKEKHQLEEDNHGLKAKLSHDQSEIRNLNHQIHELTQQKIEIHERYALLEKKNQDVLHQLQAEQQNLAYERENIVHLTNSLSEARQHEHKHIDLSERFEKLQKEHQTQVDSLLSRACFSENQVEAMKDQTKKAKDLEQEIISLKQQHEIEKREWLHQLQLEKSNSESGKESVSRLTCQLEEVRFKLETVSQHERTQVEDLEQRYQIQVQQLLEKVHESERQIELFVEQKRNLHYELVSTKKELNTVTDEKNSANIRASDLEQQLQDIQQKEHIMEQKCIAMEHKKNVLDEEMSRLTVEKNLLEKENVDLHKEIQERDRSLNQQLDSIRVLEEQLLSKTQELQSLQFRLEAILIEKDQIASENEELLIQLGFEGQKQQKLEAEFHNISASFEEQLEYALNAKHATEVHLEELREDNMRLAKEVNMLSDQIRLHEERLDENNDSLKEIAVTEASHLDIHNSTRQGLSNEANQKIEHLEKVCKDQYHQIKLLNRALEDNAENSKQKMEEIAGLKQVLSSERKNNAALAVDVEKAKAELSDQEGKYKETLRKLSHLSESLSKCQDRCKSLEDEKSSLLEQLASREQILAGKQNLVTDDAESVEFMREKIIALAMALEKSEQLRATAIDRISVERREHAESLRKVSDNVKRFYSTLTKGQGTAGS